MSNKKSGSENKKVLFVRLDEQVYNAVAALADKEDRSINWMATHLLKSALDKQTPKQT